MGRFKFLLRQLAHRNVLQDAFVEDNVAPGVRDGAHIHGNPDLAAVLLVELRFKLLRKAAFPKKSLDPAAVFRMDVELRSDVGESRPQFLWRIKPADAGHGGVGIDNLSFRSGPEDTLQGVLEDVAVLRPAFPQRILHLLALRNIPGKDGRPHYPSLLIHDRVTMAFKMPSRPHIFEMCRFTPFKYAIHQPFSDTCHVRGKMVIGAGPHQFRDTQTQPARPYGVREENGAPAIHHHQALTTGVDGGRQRRLALLQLFQRPFQFLLGKLAGGDIFYGPLIIERRA